MKKIILILVIITPFYSTCSQTAKPDTEPKEQKSKAELFSNKSGFSNTKAIYGCWLAEGVPDSSCPIYRFNWRRNRKEQCVLNMRFPEHIHLIQK